MEKQGTKQSIYIAGPMRGMTEYNFDAFDDARDHLRASGWDVVSPADMDRQAGFDPADLPTTHDWSVIPHGFDFHAAFERDINAIRRCDAVYLLRGWSKSKGARAEKAVAEWLGKTIIYEHEPAVEMAALDQHPGWGRKMFPPPYDTTNPGNSTPPHEPTKVRTFATGATRDTDENKLDYDGFLSAPVLRAFAEYMHQNRRMRDGSLRASDNWQKGIPREQYRKSAFRHFMEWWWAHRSGAPTLGAACALLFNIMGDTHEALKDDAARAG